MQRRTVSVSQLPVAPKLCCESLRRLATPPENLPMKEFAKAGNAVSWTCRQLSDAY